MGRKRDLLDDEASGWLCFLVVPLDLPRTHAHPHSGSGRQALDGDEITKTLVVPPARARWIGGDRAEKRMEMDDRVSRVRTERRLRSICCGHSTPAPPLEWSCFWVGGWQAATETAADDDSTGTARQSRACSSSSWRRRPV